MEVDSNGNSIGVCVRTDDGRTEVPISGNGFRSRDWYQVFGETKIHEIGTDEVAIRSTQDIRRYHPRPRVCALCGTGLRISFLCAPGPFPAAQIFNEAGEKTSFGVLAN